MSYWHIALDKPRFEEVLLEQLARESHVRISAMLIRLWCGSETPTTILHRWAEEHGYEIVPGGDFAGGWEVRPVGAAEGQAGLFG